MQLSCQWRQQHISGAEHPKWHRRAGLNDITEQVGDAAQWPEIRMVEVS